MGKLTDKIFPIRITWTCDECGKNGNPLTHKCGESSRPANG